MIKQLLNWLSQIIIVIYTCLPIQQLFFLSLPLYLQLHEIIDILATENHEI